MPEVVREPSHPGHASEFFLEETLAKEEGTGEAFPGRKVLVAFDPHSSDRLQTAFLDVFPDFRKEGGVHLLHEIVDGGFALYHVEIREFLHELYGLAEIVVAHLHRLAVGPQPVHVLMGVPDYVDGVLFGKDPGLGVFLLSPHSQRGGKDAARQQYRDNKVINRLHRTLSCRV